ncbi:MAG: TonB-dependent receptor [Acidobacteria bacterium]|nr:TonB-dependent receptor [Acidobacteriota bacterium]
MLGLPGFLAPARVEAQTSGMLAGTIRDSAGATVSGVRLLVRDTGTGLSRSAESGERGEYEVAGLPSATPLEIVATLDGFAMVRRTVQSLAAGERRLLDLRMEPAGISERIRVTPDAVIGFATSPELGGQLTRDQVDRVPVNGRDLMSLAYLVPGAAPARGFYNLAPRLTINGASSLVTNYSVDGFDNTDLFLGGPKVPVTFGSTENLKVLVNAYSAEYGRTGNGVFSVTTRSGSNTHSGDAFYVLRPGATLDAPNFFAPRDGRGEVVDDNFVRHQGGGSIGGPIARDRAFYFGDVELTRERQDAILTSPLAAGLAPTRFDNQTTMGKADVRWSNGQSSTVRYQFSDYTHDGDIGFVGGLTLPSAGLEVNYRNQFIAFAHRSVNGGGFNELGVLSGQLRSDWRPEDGGPRVVVTDRGATLAVLGAVSDNFSWTEGDFQIRDVYTHALGRHSLKLGADVLRGGFRIASGPGARGVYVVDLAGRPVTSSGPFLSRNDLPPDVAVLSYSQTFVNPVVEGAQLLAGAFAEDTFRAASDVTLTLGVRWDYDSVTDTPLGDGDRDNVAPRVGISWTPNGSARHQVRGGFGLFYERIPFAVRSDTIFNNPDGGAVSVTFAPGTPFVPPRFPAALPRESLQGLPLSQLPPRNVQVFDPDLRSPHTEQASVGYVVTLAADSALAIDYVHSRGRDLIRRIDTNAPASVSAGVSRSVAAADLARPSVPSAGGVRLVEQDESSGRSTFDGLYFNLRQRLSRGVAFDVAYTLARIENDTDDINFRPMDSRRPDAELGPSLNDRRHVLAVNGLVRIPRVIDLVPVLFLSSGQPLNVTTGRDDNGDTIFNDRPAGVGRNSERTSGFAQFDLGLVRSLRAGKATLEVRCEVFNVFDRANFSGFFNYGASGVRPDESGTLAFQPTVAGPARQFQLTGRLRF